MSPSLRLSLIASALLLAACGRGGDPAESAATPAATPAPAGQEVVYVYNWSDYIADDTLANFERDTGIRVVYDNYDSNEMLETKLLAGASGYDLVFPSARPFAQRHVQAGLYAPIDKSKLANYGNLDPAILAGLVDVDPGNTHTVPYMWGTTGLGINVAKVKEVLGEDAPLDSWALVLEPANLEKLKACGVAFLDTPSEIIPPVLNYLGEEPNSFDEAVIQKGVDRMMAVARAKVL